jgi:hypothetical protein
VLEKMPFQALLVAAIRTWLHDGSDKCLIPSTRKRTLKNILEILEVLDSGKDYKKNQESITQIPAIH